MRLIDADELKKDILKGIDDAPMYIQATVSQYIDFSPTVYPQTNQPLTLEELREMDGEPVWVELNGEDFIETHAWAIVDNEIECVCSTHFYLKFEDYGRDGWLAYRRKPEERTKECCAICGATGLPCSMCQPGPCESRRDDAI